MSGLLPRPCSHFDTNLEAPAKAGVIADEILRRETQRSAIFLSFFLAYLVAGDQRRRPRVPQALPK